MDDQELFLKWMATDQDEELNLERSEYISGQVPVPSDVDAQFWFEIREKSSTELDLEDLNHIRRILMIISGRGTGYIAHEYVYPDYFSNLSLNVPDAWAIEDYLSRKYWEGKAISLDNGLARMTGTNWINWGVVKVLRTLFFPDYRPAEKSIKIQDTDSKWKSVIIQLQKWNLNDITYYGEVVMNSLPWLNLVDEFLQQFINISYPVWENVTFENTTPNIVISRNWEKCKAQLDAYFEGIERSEADPGKAKVSDPPPPLRGGRTDPWNNPGVAE